ncbi:methionyl-tRNA formyltransferase [Fulvivirga sediminis]|uniref:Methionyl-tRNA formyltransferase n=1 Tax=Fulvivirga sediminis TaxID=2803949 RepID=A0A937K268_9BACT|nr:formyltransferase family protein [Fulvivirga sediminis]MBL3658256.1 hypothetical protein [Fulvivirga sediminis]
MKTVVYTCSSWGIPLLLELSKKGMLQGVILPIDAQEALPIESFAKQQGIPFIYVKETELTSTLMDWLTAISPDLAYCITFPFLLPSQIITLPRYGTVNFHFGKLSNNRGPDPLFWTLSEGSSTATITAHLMDQCFDNGPVINEINVPVFPGENWGLLGARLSIKLLDLLSSIETKLVNGHELQIEKHNDPKPRPQSDHISIRWSEQSADSVESLVNACNPKYGGAVTLFRGSLVHILEVSPADVSNSTLMAPGSIVYADNQNGIFVLCADYRFLRINVIRTPEAYLTGFKLAALGVKTNEKFYSSLSSKEESLIIH